MRDLEYIYFLPLSHSHEKKAEKHLSSCTIYENLLLKTFSSHLIFLFPPPHTILSLSRFSHPRTLFWFLSHHEQTLYMIIAYICRFTEKEVDKQINIRGERDFVGSGTCRQVAFFSSCGFLCETTKSSLTAWFVYISLSDVCVALHKGGLPFTC